MSPPSPTLEKVVDILKGARFRAASERELQEGIGQVLEDAGVPFEREKRLGPGDVIDFLVDGRVGVEVKTGGTLPALTRQCFRYVEFDDVQELLVVTARSRLDRLPREMRGKKVWVQPLMWGVQ